MRSVRTASALRAGRLDLEELEARDLLSGSPPTPIEQLFLERLNDAREDPAAYGRSIGLDLSSVATSQALAFNTNLISAARGHSQDMNDRGYFSHYTPEGIDPGQRMRNAGFSWNSWGESIAAGSAYPGPSEALRALIIDSGVSDLGHRRHLLAIDSLFKTQNQIGIGAVQGGTGPYSNYYTLDTGSTPGSRPLITGVVINDANGSGKYDVGEGLGNVTVTVQGAATTLTFDSGGFAIQVDPGVYTVTASGGGLTTPVTSIVTVGGNNARLTLTAGNSQHAGFVQKLYQYSLGRIPGAAETSYWLGILQGPSGLGGVIRGIELSPEARSRLVQRWYSTYLGRKPGGGEEAAWVTALLQGAREEDVLADLLGSDEYLNRAVSLGVGNTAQQRYLQHLYAQVLGRTATDVELQSWLPALATTPRARIAAMFLGSIEHRAGVVRGYYRDLLHRTTIPTSAELAGWAYSGLDLVQIRLAFLASPEFLLGP